MNENDNNNFRASDEQVLDGVRRRLSGVEQQVPLPGTWQPDATSRTAHRPEERLKVHVRPAGAFGFGGVIAVMLVAVVIGMGLAHQGPFYGAGSSPTASQRLTWTTIVYELQAVNGVQPTAADLDAMVEIMRERAASTGREAQVTAQPPNRIAVRLTGAANVQALAALLGQTGHLEFVLLPPATYGTYLAPGNKDVPAVGTAIDPALPAQFDGSQIDRSRVGARFDGPTSNWVVDLAFKGAAATEFEAWSGQHVDDYFAVVLDGQVISVPYIMSAITNGLATISGGFTTAADVQDLAALLRYGTLTFPASVISIAESTPATQEPTPNATTTATANPSGIIGPSGASLSPADVASPSVSP